ncbi:hypothetical protein [Flavobacterium magnesitis]|uniref:hypothetical protein n=1 Tax=Flavobacterium magnesitis TaxID=3138077 RepID=UPI00358E711E
MEDFNELEWINQFFDNAVDLQQNEGLERIKNFALFWNMFENFACGNFANVAKIESFVVKLNNRTAITNEFVIRAKGKVVAVLSRQVATPREILEALLLILLRFRNNLFHGNKQIVNLNTQVSNFTHANRLLADVLTLMKQNHLITF